MKINFTAVCPIPDNHLRRNERFAKTLGFPKPWKAERDYLAVVGGGPSLADHLPDLRKWDGDIWAINGTWAWLKDQGIDSAFYTIDAEPDVARLCIGAERAIIATRCDPTVFGALRDADVAAYHFSEDGLGYGPTSACTAPILAADVGYKGVTLFGCESSFTDQHHVYNGKPPVSLLAVKCNGNVWLTNSQMYMQAEWLSQMIRGLNGYLKEKSGGLLRAMVNDQDYDVIAASRSIHDAIRAAA